jgi:hypothetical protein
MHEANPAATHFLFVCLFIIHSINPYMVRTTGYSTRSGGTEDAVGSHVPYHETVGCLTHLMTRTRPDMAFAVSGAARAMDRPTEAH